MGKTAAGKPLTLAEGDISSRRWLSRRSLLSALGLGLAAAAAVIGARRGTAQVPTGCTDNDSGRYEDEPGYGVRCRPGSARPTGCSDDDSGPNEDAPGFGTSCRPARPTGCTDNDGGPDGDMPGFGTRCRPRSMRPTGCTDSDNGPNGDQPGLGTRCWI
jgi:hypothetical protein